MDFRHYTPPEADKKSDELNDTVKLAQLLTDAFNGKTESDVWQTALKQAEEGKRNGTLTNEQLDAFAQSVIPLLDPFKQRKLRQIIAKLKEI